MAITETRMAEHEERVRLLEARIQTLTEDNDDLRRDNELVERHNRENDYWQDNQEQLIATNKELIESNSDLIAKNKALEEQLAKLTLAVADRPTKPKQKNGEVIQERMTITQARIRAFFKKDEETPGCKLVKDEGNIREK